MARSSIDTRVKLRHLKCFAGIPGIAPGILFFALCKVALGQVELAAELFEEGDWAACRRESRRVLAQDFADHEAQLFLALSGLRSGQDLEGAKAVLDDLVSIAEKNGTRTLAAYELGRAEWAAGKCESAYHHVKFAFENDPPYDLFLRAGCTLGWMLHEQPGLAENDPSLRTQIKTSASLWDGELRKACRLEQRRGLSPAATAASWVVRFYREQISGAIGGRCSLHPSCSEYFRQACAKRGMLGFPMQADRFFREPGVVQAGLNRVEINGKVRFEDPVSDHDWWMGVD
jgi:putative component of membrane protein insertase Oxa1/YidC/SpoIIIJ protein YidD